jgi:hypothetical protein
MTHTIKEWTDLLTKFIVQTKEAIEQDDFAKRQSARDNLINFIKASPQKVEYLDDIAREALNDLSEFEVEKALADITKTSEALKKAAKLVDSITEEANKSASRIKLETILEKIEQAKDAMELLNDLEDDLTDEDKDLLEKIKSLKETLDNLEE